MNFHVRWSQAALNSLAVLWTAADSDGRDELTAASNQIDGMLSVAARTAGESRSGNVRIVFVGRYCAFYEVDDDNETASVIQFFRTRRR